jgi:hypothetical protein
MFNIDHPTIPVVKLIYLNHCGNDHRFYTPRDELLQLHIKGTRRGAFTCLVFNELLLCYLWEAHMHLVKAHGHLEVGTVGDLILFWASTFCFLCKLDKLKLSSY